MRRAWMNGLSALAVATVLVAPSVVLAQSAATDPITYQQPPAPIAQILDTKPSAAPSLSPDHDTLALFDRSNLAPIAELAEPMLRLGGYRINPRNTGPANSRVSWLTGLSLKGLDGAEAEAVARHGQVTVLRWPFAENDRALFKRFLSKLRGFTDRIFRRKKRKIFTRKNRRFVKVWRKYGVPGIAFFTPILLSPPGGSILANAFGGKRKEIIKWMWIFGAAWSLIITLLGKYARWVLVDLGVI